MMAPEEMSWMSMLLRLSKLNQKIQSTSHSMITWNRKST